MEELSADMKKQYELLRLIVQKMEIFTEDDNQDEGIATDSLESLPNTSAWHSRALKPKLLRQAAAIKHWKSSIEK